MKLTDGGRGSAITQMFLAVMTKINEQVSIAEDAFGSALLAAGMPACVEACV